jgi:hypothetical protein
MGDAMSDDFVPPPAPEPPGTLVPPERQLPPAVPSADRLATEPELLRVIRRAVNAALDVADDFADALANAIDTVRAAASPRRPGDAGGAGGTTGSAGTPPP